jgi:hypothetical protein
MAADITEMKKYLNPENVKNQSQPHAAGNVLVHVYRTMQNTSIAPDPFNLVLQQHYKQEERKANTTIVNRTSYYVSHEFLKDDTNWQS